MRKNIRETKHVINMTTGRVVLSTTNHYECERYVVVARENGSFDPFVVCPSDIHRDIILAHRRELVS